MSQHCLACGACCATFRASFYWAETTDHPQGRVPAHLTEVVSLHMVCMQGTSQKSPRCVALQGTIGTQVSCTIYANRSSTCREFEAGSDACNEARGKHGLQAIAADIADIADIADTIG